MGAQRVVNAGAQLREHRFGNILRRLSHEENAYTFRADEAHHAGNLVHEIPGSAREQQMRFVEEEHQAGQGSIAHFGKIGKEPTEYPHGESGEKFGHIAHVGKFEGGDNTAFAFVGDELAGAKGRALEEHVSALRSQG